MRKRLAKKALNGRYFNIWAMPGVDYEIIAPRNGKCWDIFVRACYYAGHPELIKKMEESLNKAVDYLQSRN